MGYSIQKKVVYFIAIISELDGRFTKREDYISRRVPIDKNYRKRWTDSDTHFGHSVWSTRSSDALIHGTKVGVLINECIGCMKCIEVCPVDVFTQWRFDDQLVVDPIREDDCILCFICETVCPVEVIDVVQEEGSEDTLNSLLAGGS